MREITSRQNPIYRKLLAIAGENGTAGREFTLLEGYRLCLDVLRSGVRIDTLVFSQAFDPARMDELLSLPDSQFDVLMLPDALFRSLASTVNPQGVACVIKAGYRRRLLDSNPEGSRHLVLENVQDPGNVGAMIRTADAMGFDDVVVLPGTASPFSAKAVRSAMGSTFHLRVYHADSIDEVSDWLHLAGCSLYAAHLDGKDLPSSGLVAPGAILIGNEGAGLSDRAMALADFVVRIPMAGKAESLNAACAAAILCYSMRIDPNKESEAFTCKPLSSEAGV